LCRASVCGPDLDRAAGRDPASGGADLPGPGRGVPAGRQGRLRGRGGRPGPGGRLGDGDALDPGRGYASAVVVPLGHATVVVDHFHAIKLANTVVDQTRRRVQQATLHHRGRKRDPLYGIRKLLVCAREQLSQRGWWRLRAGLAAGDPGGEVAAA
jgi:Transposase